VVVFELLAFDFDIQSVGSGERRVLLGGLPGAGELDSTCGTSAPITITITMWSRRVHVVVSSWSRRGLVVCTTCFRLRIRLFGLWFAASGRVAGGEEASIDPLVLRERRNGDVAVLSHDSTVLVELSQEFGGVHVVSRKDPHLYLLGPVFDVAIIAGKVP